MKEKVEFKIGPGGTLESIYQEGLEDFAKVIGAEIGGVCRASNVEWEESDGFKGWSVRAAHDPELAAREYKEGGHSIVGASRTGRLLLFVTRERALAWEVDNFWALLPAKTDLVKTS